MAIKSKKYLVDKTKTKKTKPLKPIKPKTIMLVPDLNSDFICKNKERKTKFASLYGTPSCANSYTEYEGWREQVIRPRDMSALGKDKTKGRLTSYEKSDLFLKMNFCHDCTPEYQAKMLGKFRCENPNVSFVKVLNRHDENYDGVFGVLLDPKKIREKNII
jgi:hypothetical protein